MMEQARQETTRVMTEEEIAFEKLTKKIEKLEKVVGALAVTNFLTQHEDGDEEVREQSVEKVNEFAYQFKQGWKVEKQIAELESQKRELDMKIDGLKWGNLTYKTSGRYAFNTVMTLDSNGALGIGSVAPALQIGKTAIDEKDLKALKALSGGTV